MSHRLFEQFLPEEDAAALKRCAQEFGDFEMYIQGPMTEGFGPEHSNYKGSVRFTSLAT